MKNGKKNLSLFSELHIQDRFFKLLKFFITMIAMVVVYTISFHVIMLWEGKDYSWLTGVYWTLTTMSTLGFGDITFQSDTGKVFSIFVLLSGLVYLLILFPYIFFSLFYTPWTEFQNKHRLYFFEKVNNLNPHVIIVGIDMVGESLVGKLEAYKMEYIIIVNTMEMAKDLKSRGYTTIFGEYDDPDAYKRAKVHSANLVFTIGGNDRVNTTIALTVRELNSEVEIVTDVVNRDFQDILYLAGVNNTIDITESMGRSFSRRTVAQNHFVSTIGKFDKLIVWEVPAYGSCFQDQKIRTAVEALDGLYIVGVWKRGVFIVPELDEVVTPDMILVVTGFQENRDCLSKIYPEDLFAGQHVLIIGCGRVGRATAHFLQRLNVEFKVLDNVEARKASAEKEGLDMEGRFVLGDGSKYEDLEKAGLFQASTVIISTHDDTTNTFLTLYCRKLHKNVLIQSRANLERNISTLHRAGADLVISYASTGAVAIFNILKKSNNIMLEEGLELFRIKIPKTLQGRSIAGANVRRKTGCSIIAICHPDKTIQSLPPIYEPLPNQGEIILIGSPDSERIFLEEFSDLS